ncbi:hypothetical protein HMPREF0322_03293 [Desulfitobacterium hafniense DP7]|uniref:Potassium channel domain-containing protein n=2 Tax=Desulfitobacterium hafniense TaxID=49338 RepID=G9XQP5_DESHA|nr:hypothetical protein HMPREF0322_03293 [Desulfitobacterium hafniense DP7]
MQRRLTFFGGKKDVQIPEKDQGREIKNLEMASANIGLLAPALVGAGAFFLLNQLFQVKGESDKEGGSVTGNLGSIIYTGIATTGLSYYIYNVLIAAGSRPLYAFMPFSWALGVMILYYAAVYNWIYRISPGSFEGDFGETPLEQLVSFIYFSIATFSTGGWGNFVPKSNTAKMLISMQLLFFVFIFTMGLVFFINP